MRKLATVKTISELDPIIGADFIELARVGGWQCVVKKGEFSVGQKCVYFEIDSVLPDKPEYEFMRSRKFRVRTAKFKGMLSQGIALPFHAVGIANRDLKVDTDLTETLGVTKYDPESEKELKEFNGSLKKKLPWYTKWYYGMRLYRMFNPKRGGWPDGIPKTDETRVQNIGNLHKLKDNVVLYGTEKIDGQSLTFYFNAEERTGLFSKGSTGVCSRNIHYPNKVNNNWWNYVSENHLLETLERFCRAEGRSLAVQGELAGPDIQDNKYNSDKRFFYVFNIYDIEKQRYLTLFEKLSIIEVCGWLHVPFVCSVIREYTVEEFLSVADGMSMVPGSDCPREGVVFRDIENDGFSFKAISNQWLLKYEK